MRGNAYGHKQKIVSSSIVIERRWTSEISADSIVVINSMGLPPCGALVIIVSKLPEAFPDFVHNLKEVLLCNVRAEVKDATVTTDVDDVV